MIWYGEYALNLICDYCSHIIPAGEDCLIGPQENYYGLTGVCCEYCYCGLGRPE